MENNSIKLLNLKNPKHSYIIGFLQTDGNYYCQSRNRGRISLEIKFEDIDILNKIKDELNCKSFIKIRTRNTNFVKNFKSCALSIYGLDMRTELSKYIPIGKKSDIIDIPDEVLEVDYWRGIIDGDGSLGLTNKGIPFLSLATKSFCLSNSFKKFVYKYTNYQMQSGRNNRDNIYNLILTKEKAQIISNMLYYDGCLCLERKLENSIKVKKWVRPNNMKRITWNVKKWTKEEDEFILKNNLYESMKILDRTKKSVSIRLSRLKSNKTNL